MAGSDAADINLFEEPDDETARVLDEHAELFELLHAAAESERAPLLADPGQDPQHEMKSLQDVRALANLAILRAQVRFHQERPAQAVEDLLAAMALARHVGQTPLMLAQIVAISIESKAIDVLAAHLPELTAEQRAALPLRLDSLPKAATAAELFDGERRYGDRQLHAQQTPQVDAVMAAMAPVYEAAAANADRSPEQFRQELEAAVEALPEDPPAAKVIAQSLVPALVPYQKSRARQQVKGQMLRVAVGIVDEGPTALERQPPSEQFEHRPVQGGFILRATIEGDPQPVQLLVGVDQTH